jgi:hypothetical protein
VLAREAGREWGEDDATVVLARVLWLSVLPACDRVCCWLARPSGPALLSCRVWGCWRSSSSALACGVLAGAPLSVWRGCVGLGWRAGRPVEPRSGCVGPIGVLVCR